MRQVSAYNGTYIWYGNFPFGDRISNVQPDVSQFSQVGYFPVLDEFMSETSQ